MLERFQHECHQNGINLNFSSANFWRTYELPAYKSGDAQGNCSFQLTIMNYDSLTIVIYSGDFAWVN